MTRTPPRVSPRIPVTIGCALLFLSTLVVASGLGLLILRHAPAGFATLWPPTGVALGGLLLCGWRIWPAVLAAGTLVSLTSQGLPMALVMGTGDTASALTAWYLLTRARSFDTTLRQRSDVIRFVCLGALVGTLPSPTIGVSAQYLAHLLDGPGHALTYWSTWWVGNIAGVLLATPPLLLWRRDWFAGLRATGRLQEAGVVFGALVLVAATSAWTTNSRLAMVLHTMLPLPLLLWASLRLGPFGASTAALVAAGGGVLALFAHSPADALAASAHQWRIWAYNVMFAGTALLVTVLERERAAAEATIRDREAQYRAIVENGILMFCRFRRDGVLTFVNDTCCRLLGAERAQLVGRSCRRESAAGTPRLLTSVFESGRGATSSTRAEHHAMATDGAGRWTRWNYREVLDETTGAIEIEAVGQDVTAEHRAAAEREALEVRNQALVTALGDVVYDWDADTDRFSWEGDVERVFGWPAAEVERSLEAWAARIHPDDRRQMLEGIERAGREGRVYDEEYRFERKDGSWTWLHDRAMTFVRDGRVTRMIGVLRDVTARREAEQALRASEMRFRMAAELGSDLMYEWDVASNRVIRSGRVADMFGSPAVAADSPMEAWVEILHPDDRAATLAAVEAHLLHGTAYQVQYRVIHPEGVRTWVDRAAAVRDEQGRPVRWFGVTRDVTEQVRLEEQLRQSQKMESVGLLAGGVAHDFNNLLQVIQGYTVLAQEDGLPESERYASLQQVAQASERAAALTRQLLAFGRRQPMQFADSDLADLVAQLLKMVRRLIGEHIEVDVSTGAGALAVRCDRAQIEQVLLNLCVNARDAMPRGGRLTIAVDDWHVRRADTLLRPGLREGHYARVRVMDTGSGMDEVTRRRVFEPFFTTKAEGHGTGLGLAVAYGVIKQHDGYIDVESAPGAGSTFTVLLPLRRSRTAPALLPAGPAREAAGHEVILLAEDEGAVRSLGEQVLRKAGYQVLTAVDGADALRVFDAHESEIALAILDAVMPRVSGQDVARAIGERRPSLPVLLCSGYPGSAPEVRLPEGAAFLQKPWRPQQLLSQVRQLLDTHESRSFVG